MSSDSDGRTFIDDWALSWERSIYPEMFYFCKRPPCFQQQTHLSDHLYWNSDHLLSRDTNQCQACIHKHSRSPFLHSPTFGTSFLCSRGTKAETRRRICAPTGNWRKKQQQASQKQLLPPFISIMLRICFSTSLILQSCTHLAYSRLGWQWKQ